MSKPVSKRLLAWLLAAMVTLAVAPSAAFAVDLTGGSLSGQDDASGWSDIADNQVVFTVNVDKGDGVATVAKSFTKAEMEALSKANTAPAKYVFSSKSGATVAVATKYVKIDQLLAEAKVAFEEGDTIIGWSSSFTPSKATSYTGFNDRKFFPAYDPGASSQRADGAESTPAIVAIEWGDAALASGNTAASVVNDAKSASKYQTSGKNAGLRNFWGKTTEELNGDMGGNSYCGGATNLTVSKAFKIYTRTGNGEKKLVKSYTAVDLKGLATTPDNAASAPGFLFNKNGWQVGATTSYVGIEKLLSDAGITLKAGETVAATASDGFTTYLTYDQIKNAKYFYPASTSKSLSADGAETVGAVLALNWAVTGGEYADGSKGEFPTIGSAGTAGKAKAEMFDLSDKFNAQTRVFVGLTSVSDENTGGNRFATGPVELSVVTLKDINDCVIGGIDTSYTYTGSAIEPEISVKDGTTTLSLATRKGGDYEVVYGANTALGTGSVIVKGVNAYTGTKTITFNIEGLANTFAAKAVKATQSVTYGKKVAIAANKAFKVTKNVSGGKVTYAKTSGNAKITVSKAGKVTVNKKLAVGTYTVKVKATAAAAGNYKAASKVISFKVKVNKAANTLNVKAAKATQKATYGKKTVIAAKKAFKVTKNVSGGKVTYAKVKGNAKITVSKAGKVVVRAGLKKGNTYTIKVKATSKATKNYKAKSKTVALKVKVS